MKYIIIFFCSIILQNLCLTFDLTDDYSFEPTENYNSSFILKPTYYPTYYVTSVKTYIPSSIPTTIYINGQYNDNDNDNYRDIFFLIVFIPSIGTVLLILFILWYRYRYRYRYHEKKKINFISTENLDHDFGTTFILDIN